MIVIDSTEARSGSKLPAIEDVVLSPILERVTGGDVMISASRFPSTSETLIKRHVSKGAVLVQRKSGFDFVTSILDEGINVSLARMIACGASRQYQRIIVSTGFFIPDKADGMIMVGSLKGHRAGKAFIYWKRFDPKISYRAFATIRRRIGLRGGCLLPLICDDEIPAELKAIENDLRYLAGRPTKELLHLESYPPDPALPSDPLQTPIEVRDGRRVLAAFKGIGPKKTQSLYDAILEWNQTHRPLDAGFTKADWKPSLLQLVTWASMSPERWKACEMPRVNGWAKGMRAKVREQLGLETYQDLWIETMEPESQ